MDGLVDLDDPLEVLVVEDDEDYAHLVATWLETNPVLATRVRRAASVAEASEALAEQTDLVLLDLTLPDGDGLATVRRTVDRTDAAVVVLTGTKDDRVGLESIRVGAQEFLVKDTTTSETLVRTVRYAVERQQLLLQVAELRAGQQRERELRELERVAGDRSATDPAPSDRGEVDAALGERLDQLRGDYRRVLEQMVEARTHQTGYRPQLDLRTIAELLGGVRARPRDVVDLHRHVVDELLAGVKGPAAGVLVEEGRLAVLGLMGHVAAYYRGGSLSRSDREGPP